ncbi:ATPase SWSAP1 [Guaruba guarouba]
MAAALERALRAGPGPVLVLGPEGSGRTALLLRAAMAGGAGGPRALFLAPSAPPALPGGGDPRALQRLQLRYPRSLRALCRALLARPPPPLLLLDGLERFAGRSARGAARAAALLLEAARGARPRSAPARLLAALRLPPRGPRVLPALRRFFPTRVRLRPRGAPGGE